MQCSSCGIEFKQAILLALLVDAGAKTSPSPNYCAYTNDHEHTWQEDIPDER